MKPKILAAIPARFASSRLPGKPLRKLLGRPMIEHVYSRVSEAQAVDQVVVLTDDERISEVVEGFGGECLMTPVSCQTGTDRIAFAARDWPEVDAIVNVQGDEPLIDPSDVESLARHLADHPEVPMVTQATQFTDETEFSDPNRVKVVLDREGFALYFSRSGIPHVRDGQASLKHLPLRHVGIYGYQRETLLQLANLEPTPLELAEGLEQLRALENGIKIRVLEIEEAPIGVDTEADVLAVEKLLSQVRPS